MNIIDPHVHLFNLVQGEYHWLRTSEPPFWPDKTLINRTFYDTDLLLEPHFTLSGFVHIEAGFNNSQPWQELLMLERTCKKPFKAIATIDLTLTNQKFTQCLAKLVNFNSFVGVRHIFDEQALTLLTNKQVLENFCVLNRWAKAENRKLIFEAQLSLTEHAPVNALCEVINNNANITFIINHAGFPPADIHTIEWQRWQSNLVKLAMYPHVAIKCSGWEMTDRHYQQVWLSENLTLLFHVFGKDNMMLASNFPLCLFSKKGYLDYWQAITSSDFFQALSAHEKNALCYDNALRWYSMQSS